MSDKEGMPRTVLNLRVLELFVLTAETCMINVEGRRVTSAAAWIDARGLSGTIESVCRFWTSERDKGHFSFFERQGI